MPLLSLQLGRVSTEGRSVLGRSRLRLSSQVDRVKKPLPQSVKSHHDQDMVILRQFDVDGRGLEVRIWTVHLGVGVTLNVTGVRRDSYDGESPMFMALNVGVSSNY
jgi:hypothetical protein